MICLPVLSSSEDTEIIGRIMRLVEKDLWCRIKYESAKYNKPVGEFCPLEKKIILRNRDIFVFLHELGHLFKNQQNIIVNSPTWPMLIL